VLSHYHADRVRLMELGASLGSMLKFIYFVSFQPEPIVTACMTPRKFCSDRNSINTYKVFLQKSAQIIAQQEMQSALPLEYND